MEATAPANGVQNGTETVLSANISSPISTCGKISANVSKNIKFASSPRIGISLSRNLEIIPPGGKIVYQMTVANTNGIPTTDTYIVDKILNKTVLNRAYTGPRSITPLTPVLNIDGKGFQCPG